MQNLRKFENGKFTDPQKQHGRGRGVHTSVASETRFTTNLPLGTTKRFVEFADMAARNELPLNTLLTLRWHALRSERANYPYMSLPVRVRISKTVELLRKFTTNRGSKFPWIWVQENPRNEHGGLHWHLAFHSKPEWRHELTDYVEGHFDLPRLPAFFVSKPTKGEVARSEARAWHLAVDVHPERRGRDLALYLAKGERCAKLNPKPQGKVMGSSKERFALARIKLWDRTV